MISAWAMIFDASAAKRIISTAPIAKFGAAKTLPGAPSTAARSSASAQPVAPMTTCTPACGRALDVAEHLRRGS